MRSSLSMWAARLPSAFSLPCWLSLFLEPWLLGPLQVPHPPPALGSSAPHIPGVAPHRAENPFPQPARHTSPPALQLKVCTICMGVLWALLHQAEPRSEGSTQLVLHAILRGTCLRFCIWEAPGLDLKTESVLSKLCSPRKLHSEQMPS